METLGTRLRAARTKLGLTLDELAGRTGISKPYLSLIETGRVPNPPSDEKLTKLERSLGFPPGELVTQAHLLRTPQDVRAMLESLLKSKAGGAAEAETIREATGGKGKKKGGKKGAINLDDAYLSGVLQEIVDRSAGNVERISTNAVPVVNRVAAGYPKDFTDLGYPPRVADEYIGCPAVNDKDAFAARVQGDSMAPKYREGDIVIFSPAACPQNGDDCFVRFADGNTTFKRVFFETDDAKVAVIRLQPRNERYRPQSVPSEQIAGAYKAVYKYQKVDEE